ncbi:acyltransferase [Paenibacillus tianmuensis]|uniref:acyltransferase n=1 Tax=Paenibacillus tianmuensis TaxID=624147 RepID=UPI001FDF6E1C|nr:acyltransferase [Paenibacillus tianmuensis]
MTETKRISKPKLLELDIVRAIAILAVVLIHSTADPTVELPPGSGPHAVYLTLNKLSSFAVPVFILISGLVLFYRYQDDFGGKQALQFYLKRVKQVLYPYLVWSLFYYLYNQWIFVGQNLHWKTREFLGLLKWGEASYHLYFMIIIIQFYLLFPLLMWLCRTFPCFRSGLIWIGLFIQTGFYAYHIWVKPIGHMPALAINYFSMFTLGGWIGLHYEAFAAWIRKHFVWVLPLTAVLGFGFMGLSQMEVRLKVDLAHPWNHVLYYAYAAFAAMSFIRLGQLLLERAKAAARVLMTLGAASFGIYLAHPALMTYYKMHVLPFSSAMSAYHAYIFEVFALCLTIPWIATFLYGQAMRSFRRKKPKLSPGGSA